MSLKTIHLFFITAPILLSSYFAYWNWSRFETTQSISDIFFTAVALILTAALFVYLILVWKKFKKLNA